MSYILDIMLLKVYFDIASNTNNTGQGPKAGKTESERKINGTIWIEVIEIIEVIRVIEMIQMIQYQMKPVYLRRRKHYEQ